MGGVSVGVYNLCNHDISGWAYADLVDIGNRELLPPFVASYCSSTNIQYPHAPADPHIPTVDELFPETPTGSALKTLSSAQAAC